MDSVARNLKDLQLLFIYSFSEVEVSKQETNEILFNSHTEFSSVIPRSSE
jgi:hypothetical protein